MFVLFVLSILATRALAQETKRYVVWKIPDGSILFLAQGDNDIKRPGVKMVIVSIKNESTVDLPLNMLTDRWTLVDNKGQAHSASFNSLNIDTAIWLKMPEKAQRMMDYPRRVHSGTSKHIVLIFEPTVDLINFQEVILDSVAIGKPIRIKYKRQEG